jgi:acyl-coenzyme A synthetase/AMP-(fatty) acid ligase
MPEPFAPCPAPFNMAAHALHRAADLGSKPALEIVGDAPQSYGYARLEACVRGCGTYLMRQGLIPGDRILMRLGNSPAFPILFLGAIAVGLIPVPTAAALTAREITAMAALIAPRLIVADAGVALPDYACPVVEAAAILAAETLPACGYDMGDPNRLAYIVFTSGTSGKPLPVAHAHRAIWARRMMYQGWEGLSETDRLLHAGALNWTYTLGTGLLDPWVQGATALIPSAQVRPADLAALLHQHRVTIFAAAPGVYRQILKTDPPPLPHLRHGLSAGEALAPNLAARWTQATGTAVHQALGLSECSTFISGSPARPAPAGSIGYPQPGRRIAILSETGAELPPDHPGILAIHRDDPGLMLGYWDAPQATADRFVGDWFLTGDHVSQAPDGAITYLGRQDDMMNPGGFRVSPAEVEAAMALLPSLTDCAAVEAEPTPGTRIIACLYTSDYLITDKALADHAHQTLARYKQPRLFIRLDALPRNANNKLNRAQLRTVAQRHISAQELP